MCCLPSRHAPITAKRRRAIGIDDGVAMRLGGSRRRRCGRPPGDRSAPRPTRVRVSARSSARPSRDRQGSCCGVRPEPAQPWPTLPRNRSQSTPPDGRCRRRAPAVILPGPGAVTSRGAAAQNVVQDGRRRRPNRRTAVGLHFHPRLTRSAPARVLHGARVSTRHRFAPPLGAAVRAGTSRAGMPAGTPGGSTRPRRRYSPTP